MSDCPTVERKHGQRGMHRKPPSGGRAIVFSLCEPGQGRNGKSTERISGRRRNGCLLLSAS
eukprot:5535858-Pyramimonas_sp.AAC.1